MKTFPESQPVLTVPSGRLSVGAPPVRRVSFGHAKEFDSLPKYFMNGDPVMSHFMAVFSSLFPEGEQFFIRTVRNHRELITDPTLRRHVAGFIGQEAVHGREHTEFNDLLHGLGYRTDLVDKMMGFSMRTLERFFSPETCLAVTAALEHSTTTSGVVVLESSEAKALFGTEEVRSLFLWHALEEVEHKAVAFDVLSVVAPGENKRRVVGFLTTSWLISTAGMCTAASVLTDAESWRHPLLVIRGLAVLPKSPWLNRKVFGKLDRYFRKGFHPNEENTEALISRYRAELFGDTEVV